MEMKYLSGNCLIIFLFLILGTGLGESDNNDINGNTINIVEQTSTTIADSVNSFGYKLLLQMMKENKDKNVIISPTSISGLLAMTLLGTVGRSYDELAATLGFSRDVSANRKNHEKFGDLLKALNGNETSKTMYADCVFVDVNSRLRDAYRMYLKRVYDGEATSLNFSDQKTAQKTINKWVSDHTSNLIQDFLKEPLPSVTRAVLLSALYFKGQWQNPFTPEFTQKTLFKKPDGEVMADLMLNFGEFNYIYSVEEELQMVALPYNDSVNTMYAIKPRHPKTMSLQQLLNRLDYDKINKIIEQMTVKRTVIRFPRMELQGAASLEEHLKMLGVRTIFSPGEANFALMIDSNSVVNKTENELLTRLNDDENIGLRNLMEIINGLPNPGVHIDSVIHDVKIIINEYGTEAAAATSGILSRTAELFYVDSPFYIFIRNEKTKLITFSAVIYDPTV